jgi:positive regulator of sigma E activity
LKIATYLLPLLAIIVYLVLDTLDSTERLKSCIGVVVIMVLGFAFSRHPGQVGSTSFNCQEFIAASKITYTFLHTFKKLVVIVIVKVELLNNLMMVWW